MENFKKRIATCLFSLMSLWALTANGAIPANYYNSCENKGGQALLTALYTKITDHTAISYAGLWTLFKTSDVKANGKIWDMYSTKEWTPGSEQCGNYSNIGDCYNREHSFPKSWFNDATPMYTDAFHLYPTDGKVNSLRSNYPLGECANGNSMGSYGSIKGLGKLGASTVSGYRGTVYEPDDEYKGDFARSYFYMVTAYNDRVSNWNSEMLAGNSYPAFQPWAIEVLLKWHRQDPVSEKELSRNEVVYKNQGNRNPYIDNPEMVEYIWGDKKTENWSSSAASQAVLTLPVNKSDINLGTIGVGVARTYTVAVKGNNLKGNLSVSVSGSNVFGVSPVTLTSAAVNSSNGTSVTITANASSAGNFTGILNLKSTSDNINTSVNLSVSALNGLPATAPTDITDESFMAHWTYVGDADSHGCYTLYVLDEAGENIDTYPRSVPAEDEEYLVDELEPETNYVFYITSKGLTSNRMNVRTTAPLPSIQILYDGDLELETEPGVPSEAEELLLDIENINENITLRIDSPFELSHDKNDWSNVIVVDPREDRIYIRIFGDKEGVYTSSLTATAGDYFDDSTEVSGQIKVGTSFLEDFETEVVTGTYNTADYTGNGCKWKFSNAGTYKAKGEAYEGESYLRFGNNSDSRAEMAEDVTNGIGTVSLMAAGWSAADGSSKFKVQYSTDQGKTWNDAGEAEIATPSNSTKTYSNYKFVVNCPGTVRMRLLQTYGKRMCIDNIAASTYLSSVTDELVFGDEKGTGWDAYCRNGVLVVETQKTCQAYVHGTDGITYVNTHIGEGMSQFELPAGLYVVVIGNSTRRVLVK